MDSFPFFWPSSQRISGGFSYIVVAFRKSLAAMYEFAWLWIKTTAGVMGDIHSFSLDLLVGVENSSCHMCLNVLKPFNFTWASQRADWQGSLPTLTYENENWCRWGFEGTTGIGCERILYLSIHPFAITMYLIMVAVKGSLSWQQKGMSVCYRVHLHLVT